tara:strand:+ start:4896 stop:5483 length:588 start_codon:yes stop_codon:yes gene_type:complete
MDSSYSITDIASQISKCKLCELHKNRTLTVPGHGDPNSKILIIGEAPGQNEDQKGIPFVGRAGHILDSLLESINIDRTKIFITNMVKCRPPQNRDPNVKEIIQCSDFLDHQISIINPLVIITLGRLSLKKFLPNTSIKIARGSIHKWKQYNIFPIYHPAAALYNPKLLPKMKSDFKKISSLIDGMETDFKSTHME